MDGYNNQDKPAGPDPAYTHYPDPRPRSSLQDPMNSIPPYNGLPTMAGNSSLAAAPSSSAAPASSSPAVNGFGSADQEDFGFNFVPDPLETMHMAAHQSPFVSSSHSGLPSGANAGLPLHQQSFQAPHNPPPQSAHLAPVNPVQANPPQPVIAAQTTALSAPVTQAPVPALGPINVQASVGPAPAPAPAQAPVAPPAPAPAPAPIPTRAVVPPPPISTVLRTEEETKDILSVISYEPSHILAATAKVDEMDAARLLHALEAVYYRQIGRDSSKYNETENATADNDANVRTRVLGNFTVLPLELLFEIFDLLPLNDLLTLLSINKTIRGTIQARPEFKRMLKGSLNPIATVLKSEMGRHINIGDIPRLMQRRDCEICKSRFGPFLFLPTFTRCCYICFQTDNDFEVTTITGATRMRRVSRAALLRRVPAVMTIPGNYGLSQTLYVQHLYLVSVKQIEKFFDRRPDGPGRIDDLIPGMRMLAATALPYYNTVTRAFERGVLCKGCELAKVPGRERTLLLSNQGLMGHFESCPHAEKMWKREQERRGIYPGAEEA